MKRMKDALLYIGNKIITSKKELARNFSALLDSEYKNKLIYREEAKILEWRAEIIEYLGEALFEEQPIVSKKVTKWARDIGKLAVENGLSLSQILKSLTFLRTVIWDVFTEELQQRKFAPITMLDVSKIIDPFIDEINHIFVDIYEAHNHEKMKLAYMALEEL